MIGRFERTTRSGWRLRPTFIFWSGFFASSTRLQRPLLLLLLLHRRCSDTQLCMTSSSSPVQYCISIFSAAALAESAAVQCTTVDSGLPGDCTNILRPPSTVYSRQVKSLFHDLLLSPISQQSVRNEITSHCTRLRPPLGHVVVTSRQ